ncbi:30S ribosomal protein S20 [candidate division WWE3 bacterium]|uniref:Small ribosomal subunit protein bS20 n=1 Tax=candidate division WWE3 bacterium TaxID=2053526 RepID=A0A7X9HTT3_UNCKA|nr:30S ribosomal protein S20 [candidate division WWE3 bacterium]
MANTKSAKKNIRASLKKRSHNNMWEKRFKNAIKSLSRSIKEKEEEGVVKEKLKVLQKVLDKASKEKVIHKNKANRVKSKYALKVSALFSKEGEKPKLKPERKSSKSKAK